MNKQELEQALKEEQAKNDKLYTLIEKLELKARESSGSGSNPLAEMFTSDNPFALESRAYGFEHILYHHYRAIYALWSCRASEVTPVEYLEEQEGFEIYNEYVRAAKKLQEGRPKGDVLQGIQAIFKTEQKRK